MELATAYRSFDVTPVRDGPRLHLTTQMSCPLGASTRLWLPSQEHRQPAKATPRESNCNDPTMASSNTVSPWPPECRDPGEAPVRSTGQTRPSCRAVSNN